MTILKNRITSPVFKDGRTIRSRFSISVLQTEIERAPLPILTQSRLTLIVLKLNHFDHNTAALIEIYPGIAPCQLLLKQLKVFGIVGYISYLYGKEIGRISFSTWCFHISIKRAKKDIINNRYSLRPHPLGTN